MARLPPLARFLEPSDADTAFPCSMPPAHYELHYHIANFFSSSFAIAAILNGSLGIKGMDIRTRGRSVGFVE